MNTQSSLKWVAGALTSAVLVTGLSACSPDNQPVTPWNRAYGGVDKSYDTGLLKQRDEMASRFQTLSFVDEVTGRTMTYNLYVPEHYDPNQNYPLVLFMADASTVGKGTEAPLKQGYGGFIWATPEEQAKHPAFVLVPAFAGPERVTNDDWQVSDELGMALRLLGNVAAEYSIDPHRLYTTGQSMGGMISFYLNAHYPDLFAASLYVGSQWDVNVLKPLQQQRFVYVVSAGDPKASKGMADLGNLLTTDGVAFGSTHFSARLSLAEQNQQVDHLLAQRHAINFVQFDANTVVPEGMDGGRGGEHMYSFDYAYQLTPVRDWLFQQSRAADEHRLIDSVMEDEGLRYFEGKGVEQNYTTAAAYFRIATALGHMKAPRYLGIAYEEGLGVSADLNRALDYYQQAVAKGDITAAARIGWLYERGLGVEQSYEKAYQWYIKAAINPEESARHVHPRVLAAQRLAFLYEQGLGVTQDLGQAAQWAQIAASDTE